MKLALSLCWITNLFWLMNERVNAVELQLHIFADEFHFKIHLLLEICWFFKISRDLFFRLSSTTSTKLHWLVYLNLFHFLRLLKSLVVNVVAMFRMQDRFEDRLDVGNAIFEALTIDGRLSPTSSLPRLSVCVVPCSHYVHSRGQSEVNLEVKKERANELQKLSWKLQISAFVSLKTAEIFWFVAVFDYFGRVWDKNWNFGGKI